VTIDVEAYVANTAWWREQTTLAVAEFACSCGHINSLALLGLPALFD
jgi:hypothetical protein